MLKSNTYNRNDLSQNWATQIKMIYMYDGHAF
jgi:hypothetical protein